MAAGRRRAIALLLGSLLAAAAGHGAGAFELESPAFAAGDPIPERFTCDGANVSPPLAWREPPERTRSFALVVKDPDAPDPDAPRTVWTHWVVYDLPADARSLEAGVLTGAELPEGAHMGQNDWGKVEWGGPCPPVGRHRYVFELYALDVALGDRGALARRDLERASAGHVLGRAELVGTYRRSE